MCFNEVVYVYKIAYTGTVIGIIVSSKDFKDFSLFDRRIYNHWYDASILRISIIQSAVSNDVEVAKDDVLEAMNFRKPLEVLFGYQFCEAVIVCWLRGVVFVDGKVFGFAVHRGGGREDELWYFMPHDFVQEIC